MARSRNLGYSEGSVYQQPDGRWRGEYRRGSVRRRVSGWTRAEAVQKLDEVRANASAGLAVGDDTRLGSFIDWWLEEVGSAKSPRTADHDRWALGQLDKIRGKSMRDLKVEDVEAELKRLASRKVSRNPKRGGSRGPLGHSALGKVRRALAKVLTEAERREKINRNVAKLARIPRTASKPTKRRSLTPSEARKLVKASRG